VPARLIITGVVLAVVAALVALGGTAAVASNRLELSIVVTPKEPRPDVFVLKGQVLSADGQPSETGAYPKGRAILQRRNCGRCKWFAFERFETDRDSRFKLHVPDLGLGEKLACYRVKVPRSNEAKRTLSQHHCITPISPGG
jgi:hypothetical protein